MGIYLVKPSDTVWSIAKQYGISSQSIIEANGLQNSVQLIMNQSLFIPLGEKDRGMSSNDITQYINRVAPGAPTKLVAQRNTLISVVLF